MRSIRFDRFGEPIDVLRVAELRLPEPGPGEVRLRMTARPIHPADLYLIRGRYGRRPNLPAAPGLEGTGTVDAIGPDVQRVLPGQRVIPLDVCGTWQEYMVVRESELLMVPEGLDDTLAAQFFVNPLTAWIMTTDQLAVEPGAWLLQTAAASTLGRMVVQIARIRGFRTINVVRRRTAVEDLKVLGADEVICTAEENLVERVKILTGGVGVPAAIDAVGGEIGSQVVRSLAADGMLLIYGALALEPIALSTGLMIFRSLQVRGFWLSKWLGTTPMQRQLDVMSQVLDLMTQGKLAPSVAASYDLGAVHDAVLHAEQAGRKGKILLRG